MFCNNGRDTFKHFSFTRNTIVSFLSRCWVERRLKEERAGRQLGKVTGPCTAQQQSLSHGLSSTLQASCPCWDAGSLYSLISYPQTLGSPGLLLHQ
jgi:hypothetical protein